MTVYTVSSADDIMSEPLSTLVAGTYTTRGRALDECVAYIMERLENRQDLAWSMLNDENHPEAGKFLVEHRDGTVGVRRGCLSRLKAFIRDELGGTGCYYIYDGGGRVWHFDVDENDLEGQLWTTVTWGDSDCEDPEFTTPFPETFASEDKAIENFYHYAVDLKKQYSDEGVSEGFKPWVYDSLRKNGKCQVDLGDGCCVSCVLYSTPAGGVR